VGLRISSQQKILPAHVLIVTLGLAIAVLIGPNAKATPTDAAYTTLPDTNVAEPYPFFGLAAFYNAVRVDLVTPDDIQPVPRDGETNVLGDEWLVVSGRYEAQAIRATGLEYTVTAKGVATQLPLSDGSVTQRSPKSELYAKAPELEQLRYAHLWNWLGVLAKLVESGLTFIHTHIVSSWGMAIVVLALVVKILLLPVSLLTARLQRQVSSVQSTLLPELAQIKANYDGEEAHERIMAAHSTHGVSPFYTLKPMLGTLIQVPVLIAVFNALGEMPALRGQGFLWVQDLAYPDSIAQLGFAIPLLGDKLSLLPFLMTAVTVWATLTLTRELISESALRAEKNRMLMMAAGFFVLFYPFPAAMVLYWTCTNLFQLPLQKLLKT